MRTTLRILASAAALALPFSAQAQTQLLTEDFGGTQATAFHCEDNFTSFCYTRGPMEVGGNGYSVLMSSGLVTTNNQGSVIGTGYYGLEANGGWWGDKGTYAGTDGASLMNYGLRFVFDRPIYSVGAWMNYSPTGMAPALLKAYGLGGQLLAEYDLRTLAPISTPRQWNGQEFRGIESTTGIYMFELAGSYLVTRDLFVSETQPETEARFFSLLAPEGDDEGGPEQNAPLFLNTEEAPAVVTPEPSTYALMGAGLLAVGLVQRRRRNLNSSR